MIGSRTSAALLLASCAGLLASPACNLNPRPPEDPFATGGLGGVLGTGGVPIGNGGLGMGGVSASGGVSHAGGGPSTGGIPPGAGGVVGMGGATGAGGGFPQDAGVPGDATTDGGDGGPNPADAATDTGPHDSGED